MRKKCGFMVLVLALTALAACNTVRGVGKDIEDGGRTIQRATH
jgi:predicted small secreted protein